MVISFLPPGGADMLPPSEVWEHAYSKQYILQGFESVGIKHLHALNRHKLLVERAPQLIKSFVKKTDVDLETEVGQAVLTGPYTVPSKCAPCAVCQKQTPTHLPRCGFCGEGNSGYSAAAAAVHKGGKSSGYSKQTDVFDVQKALSAIPADKRSQRYNFMGDLLGEMRGRKRKAEENPEGEFLLVLFFFLLVVSHTRPDLDYLSAAATLEGEFISDGSYFNFGVGCFHTSWFSRTVGGLHASDE